MTQTIEQENFLQRLNEEEPPPPYRPQSRHTARRWRRTVSQLLRFGLVGGLNTTIDLLALNTLLWLFSTQDTKLLLMYNSIAYGVGAVNSFIWNKYWTFRNKHKVTFGEVARFAATTLLGIACNDTILWLVSNAFHPLIGNARLWANASKVLAIFGTFLVSYLGMRLWVFVHHPRKDGAMQRPFSQHMTDGVYDTSDVDDTSEGLVFVSLPGRDTSVVSEPKEVGLEAASHTRAQHSADVENIHSLSGREWRERPQERDGSGRDKSMPGIVESLSVVLPAYNEEEIIAATIADVLHVLSEWETDFEVIVVNDGSKDRTGAIVSAIGAANPRVRLVTHAVNQGYGAALVSGFAAVSKKFTFFMDSDGQFDICDLTKFFQFIDEYDAVIGYRIDRQDTWTRKLNAFGWKVLVWCILEVYARDIDCAFKLLRTEFLHEHPLETRGAMINAELLYKLTRAGCTYRQVGVHHLPRRGGRATGAKLSVIIRAFRELFIYSRKWNQEERMASDFQLR